MSDLVRPEGPRPPTPWTDSTLDDRRTGRRWLTDLTPGPLGTVLRLAVGGTVEHLRLRWTDADPTLVTFREPAVTTVPSFDLVRTEATAPNGTSVASLEITVRHPEVQPGTPCSAPDRPTLPPGASGRAFIVRSEEIEQHLEEVRSTLETTPARATRDGGMPLPVVPTTLLVQVIADSTLQRSAGEIEAWFLASVPAGALISTREYPPEGLVELRLPGRGEAAVILRCAPTPADDAADSGR